MESQSKALVLQAENLELKIGSKTLGALTTNAKDIKALVEQALPNYSIENYSEANIEQAKSDKAMLNNASKVLNSKRIELEKEWLEPFMEFKTIIAETNSLISECSGKIDGVVKESENKAKAEKKASIEVFWNLQKFALVPFSKVFDEKWLNKTAKDKVIHSEIQTKIAEIKDGLSTLEAIDGDTETLKAMFLDNLNINETIKYANTLKVNKEKMSSGYVSAPAPTPEAIMNVEVASEVVPAPETAFVTEELLERTFKVTATYDKLVALGNFMNENGITFQKL